MARPKKIEEEGIDITPEVEEELPELKDCLNCGGEAAIVTDKHGYFRCHCQVCGYWDSVVSHTKKEAADSWNASGDPRPSIV